MLENYKAIDTSNVEDAVKHCQSPGHRVGTLQFVLDTYPSCSEIVESQHLWFLSTPVPSFE